jgi:hypothetical protein
VRKDDNLPPSSADVTESRSPNLPEPSGLQRPVMGILKKNGDIIIIINERFIAPINIKIYMIVTRLFLNYNQFTTVS